MEIGREESGVLRIEGVLDISVAADLQDTLRRFMGESQALVVDLSKVESCDTTAIQVFCAARKSAETTGKQIQFVHPSGALTDTTDRLGFASGVFFAESADQPDSATPDPGA
ncbi:MAG: STAS domain-containing protein [Bryobacteraceae bacterium]